MTAPEPENQGTQNPSPERQPDQLDVLALTLVGLTHQLQAVMGSVRTALMQVNIEQAKRDGGTPQQHARRVMSRADAGFTGPGPQQQDGAPGGRPLPPHPDRTFMAKRRNDAEAEQSTTESPT